MSQADSVVDSYGGGSYGRRMVTEEELDRVSDEFDAKLAELTAAAEAVRNHAVTLATSAAFVASRGAVRKLARITTILGHASGAVEFVGNHVSAPIIEALGKSTVEADYDAGTRDAIAGCACTGCRARMS